jgi:hypothetical protein
VIKTSVSHSENTYKWQDSEAWKKDSTTASRTYLLSLKALGSFIFRFQTVFLKNLIFILYKKLIFLYVLDCFDVLILKIFLKK